MKSRTLKTKRPPILRNAAIDAANAQRYDEMRGTPRDRGYDEAWSRCRHSYLSAHPLCEDCQKFDILTPADEVHHIIPLRDGGDKLNFENLRALCRACHKKADNDYKRAQSPDCRAYH